MKLQHIAAALALVAAGTANAAIATGGNGSLVLIAYDNRGGTTTAGVFDLGLTFDDLVGSTGNGSGVAAGSLAATAGQNIVWDFNANTIKVNGVTQAYGGTNSWDAAFSTLLANSQPGDLRFVVTAFDNTGIGALQRSIVTGISGNTTSSFSSTQTTTLQQISGGKSNDIFAPIANKGTNATAGNGAFTFVGGTVAATRANGYAMAGDGFGVEWRTANVLTGETLASNTAGLYIVDGTTKYKEFAQVAFSAENGTLTLTTPVPEPTTYALLVSGLAMVGALARRRRAA